MCRWLICHPNCMMYLTRAISRSAVCVRSLSALPLRWCTRFSASTSGMSCVCLYLPPFHMPLSKWGVVFVQQGDDSFRIMSLDSLASIHISHWVGIILYATNWHARFAVFGIAQYVETLAHCCHLQPLCALLSLMGLLSRFEFIIAKRDASSSYRGASLERDYNNNLKMA